jgi:hypothetical protein
MLIRAVNGAGLPQSTAERPARVADAGRGAFIDPDEAAVREAAEAASAIAREIDRMQDILLRAKV